MKVFGSNGFNEIFTHLYIEQSLLTSSYQGMTV